MNDIKSIELVKNVFNVIEKANNVNEIYSLLTSEPELFKNKINTLKYPKIEYTLSDNDIKLLKKINYISTDNRLNISKEELNKQSLLTKLLYSIIWKNGDLGKEKHIIEGVLNFNKIDEKGLVFYHFGKYLGDEKKKEPIIDQHTLRAYGIYLCLSNKINNIIDIIPKKRKNFKNMDVDYYRKLYITSRKELPLISEYKKWIKNHKLYENIDFVYTLDLVLFALGKSIKSNSKSKAE